MNRRSFLKRFSAAVVGTVAAVTLPLSTPLTERVAVAKTHVKLVTDFIEIPIDQWNTLRITKLQYYTRLKSFTDKGYVLSQDGKTLRYTPKYVDFYDEEWVSE